jgi:NAD(P)-dependent dehydrogenase (short-subunit alcohol dehydrogenase family)
MSKNIIITGTSRGIGLQLAMQLATEGHQVLAISRKSNNLLKHPNISILNIDLVEVIQLKEVKNFIENSWQKKVDVVIHNAGSLLHKEFEKITPEEFLNIYQVNVFAVAQLTQICLPFMYSGSHVVTISSMGGIQGSAKFAGLSAYSSSKGAVITLSELLAEEYKEKGISFNVLAIGAVNTEMLQEAFPGYEAPVSAEEMASYIANFALTANKFYNGKVLQVSSSTP